MTIGVPGTLLIPVDYGKPSQVALEHALQLARMFGSKLVVVFVWAAPYAAAGIASDELGRAQKDLFDRVRHEAADTMVQFIQEVQRDAPDLQLEWFVVSGEPKHKIIEVADEHHADWIVMGNHNRGGVGRWFLGSVSEYVLRHAHRPVFVVPYHDESAPD